MKFTIPLLLSAAVLLPSVSVAASNAITPPTLTSVSATEVPNIFSEKKLPIAIVGGYQIENAILTARTLSCGINVSDLEIEAKLRWDGTTPKILLVGMNLIMCRSGVTSPFSIDLSEFIHNIPVHVLDRLEVANNVSLGL
ncbi:Putative exported protein [Moritella viscosa]|uniref:hypothetical protein n=1 Tax=Moritella viscosa TaxID=80854 RepID=UPI000508EFEE|nr:hypothetical protein [Moritella viscosa]CED59420.1 putative exported protein [Moritella viscosa]SHO01513.1 Putative exported protein [Moritella viscosa]SHO20523.1 Putative exported protein [Moritella viscosa]